MLSFTDQHDHSTDLANGSSIPAMVNFLIPKRHPTVQIEVLRSELYFHPHSPIPSWVVWFYNQFKGPNNKGFTVMWSTWAQAWMKHCTQKPQREATLKYRFKSLSHTADLNTISSFLCGNCGQNVYHALIQTWQCCQGPDKFISWVASPYESTTG